MEEINKIYVIVFLVIMLFFWILIEIMSYFKLKKLKFEFEILKEKEKLLLDTIKYQDDIFKEDVKILKGIIQMKPTN